MDIWDVYESPNLMSPKQKHKAPVPKRLLPLMLFEFKEIERFSKFSLIPNFKFNKKKHRVRFFSILRHKRKNPKTKKKLQNFWMMGEGRLGQK